MKTTGFALMVGCAAALLVSGAAGGCGGVTALLDDGGTDGQAGSGSGGGTSSSSGFGSSSSTSSGGGTSSSSGFGSSSSTSSGGGTSSSSGEGSSSSGGSGSSSGVSSSSSSGGSSSGGPNSGAIYFEECSAGGPLCMTPQFQFYALFGQDSSGTQGCTVTTSGACSSYTCNGTQPPPQNGLSAGILSISGGSLGTMTVTPDSTNTYQYSASALEFSAGQTLSVKASGATVPPFGASVVAPGLPLLEVPTASNGSYTLPTKSDMKIAWTGGDPAAQFIIEAATGNSASYFTCTWPASASVGVIPQAMLASLAGQTSGYLVYGQYTLSNTLAGPYHITVQALPYSGGTATFQ